MHNLAARVHLTSLISLLYNKRKYIESEMLSEQEFYDYMPSTFYSGPCRKAVGRSSEQLSLIDYLISVQRYKRSVVDMTYTHADASGIPDGICVEPLAPTQIWNGSSLNTEGGAVIICTGSACGSGSGSSASGPVRPCHKEPELLQRYAIGLHYGDYLSFIDHSDSVGEV